MISSSHSQAINSTEIIQVHAEMNLEDQGTQFEECEQYRTREQAIRNYWMGIIDSIRDSDTLIIEVETGESEIAWRWTGDNEI